VIVDAVVHLGPGLNVLTGETGAGKSIVVDSLALLSGARASSDLVRSGAATLSVTGIFEPQGDGWRRILAEAGFDLTGEELVVRREVSREGRNRVFLNDQPVTLNLLSMVAPSLLRIHTQREELGIVSPDLQRAWLDRSGGAEADEPCLRVRESFGDFANLAARLGRAQGDEQLRQERIDLLKFQSDEIDAARLRPDEDVELKIERDALRHSEAITAALGASYELLFEDEGAAVERISQAVRKLLEVADWEHRSGDWAQELETLNVGLEELTRDLRRRLDAVDADPVRLDAIEERLSLIERLSHKYRGNCAEVLEHRQQIAGELDELIGDVTRREEIEKQVEGARALYKAAAADLSGHRRQWAERMADRVHRELADLALGKARFNVAMGIRRREDGPLELGGVPVESTARGYDQITYELAANPGEELMPLSRSASGGELSRIYLAVQLAIRAGGPAATSTLVFDEVDAGIGGAQAAALGRKLARLSRGGQILVVTHLPQVASHADCHFRVEKRLAGDRTETDVVALDRDARVEEVARMLAGRKVTDLSLSHAEELIATAGAEP